MTRFACMTITGLALLCGLSSCEREAADGPPSIRLGESVCVECDMIISDERFATATIVEGPRGPEPRLFDDFNCQVNYESSHPEEEIITRWSHDYHTVEWLPTVDAYFLCSSGLRTPMASNAAAFSAESGADALASELGGDTMRFETLWKRLSVNGGSCAHDSNHTNTTPEKEQTDE